VKLNKNYCLGLVIVALVLTGPPAALGEADLDLAAAKDCLTQPDEEVEIEVKVSNIANEGGGVIAGEFVLEYTETDCWECLSVTPGTGYQFIVPPVCGAGTEITFGVLTTVFPPTGRSDDHTMAVVTMKATATAATVCCQPPALSLEGGTWLGNDVSGVVDPLNLGPAAEVMIDMVPPEITACPLPRPVCTEPGTCLGKIPNLCPEVQYTDTSCGECVCEQDPEAGDEYPPSATPVPVELTVTDPCGNSDSCIVEITVKDCEPPRISGCPTGAIEVCNDAGLCCAVLGAGFPDLTAEDNCDGVVPVECTVDLGGGPVVVDGTTCFPVGTTVVTCCAEDSAGNESCDCQFEVKVNDCEAPALSGCPSDITEGLDPGQCTKVVDWTPPTAVDNCDGPVPVVCTADLGSGPEVVTPGTAFPVGTTTVTCCAQDSATPPNENCCCPFTVTILDDKAPVWKDTPCHENVEVCLDPGVCGAVVDFDDPAFEDCDPNAWCDCTPPSGSSFPVGTTQVTCIAKDTSNNESDPCVFDVIVTDNEGPLISGCPVPPVITVDNDKGKCGAVVDTDFPVLDADDVCDGPVPVTCTADLGAGPQPVGPGTFFPVGDTVVTCDATDTKGNPAQNPCTFTISVEDTEDPIAIACPSNVCQGNDPGVCWALVLIPKPLVSDNCGIASLEHDVAWIPDKTDATGEYPVGTTVVTWTACDVADPQNCVPVCTQEVTVEDCEPPELTDCPDDITVCNDPGVCEAEVAFTPPTAQDNCDGAVEVKCTADLGAGPVPITSPTVFPVGTTTVTCEATDSADNTSTCTFDVKVEDCEDPKVNGCPGDFNVNADAGKCCAVVDWTPPTCTDNCPGVICECLGDFGAGPVVPVDENTCFPGGPGGLTTTVTCTATDAAGNTAECTFDVTVSDKNDLLLSVELSPTMVNDVDMVRCITLELIGDTNQECDVDITFPAVAAGEDTTKVVDFPVEIPCGNYTCITAQDKLHSLRRAVSVAAVPGQPYVADFTGDPDTGGKWLLGGDLDDDGKINLFDFVVMAPLWTPPNAPSDRDTPCGTPGPHCDIDGNTLCDADDLNFIRTNYQKVDEDCPVDSLALASTGRASNRRTGRSRDVSRIRVSSLRRMGYVKPEAADVNHDGWVDMRDINLVLSGAARPGD